MVDRSRHPFISSPSQYVRVTHRNVADVFKQQKIKQLHFFMGLSSAIALEQCRRKARSPSISHSFLLSFPQLLLLPLLRLFVYFLYCKYHCLRCSNCDCFRHFSSRSQSTCNLCATICHGVADCYHLQLNPDLHTC